MLLDRSNTAITAPEQRLDEIYTTVLRHCIPSGYSVEEAEEFQSMLRILLGSLVTLFAPLSTGSLSNLLGIPQAYANLLLMDLHAIVDIPGDPCRPLHLHHPSFRDFLFDERRCGSSNFFVDEKLMHRKLSRQCIQLMSTSFDQNNERSDQLDASTTQARVTRAERYLLPEIQYACLHWVEHLQKSRTQPHEINEVSCFLRLHVLHWLEALGWIRKVPDGIRAIASLELFASSVECHDLSNFLHDIKRFVLYNRTAIELDPVQTYCSAIVFAPSSSLVRGLFENRVTRWVSRLPRIEENWSPLLQTLEGHTGSLSAVVFSPSGRTLASASYDKTIKLWDTQSGAMLQTLQGHDGYVRDVRFSPDGKMLVSASEDRTAMVWDIEVGTLAWTLEGHSAEVSTASFSPDGQLVVSASHDNTIKLWDIKSRTLRVTLCGHSDIIVSVVFSPDGTMLATGSVDASIKLWNLMGTELRTLRGHSGSITAIVFSHTGQLLISASVDGTIKLWNTGSGTLKNTLGGHSDKVPAVTFSPDGQLLASPSWDNAVKLWDVHSGRLLRTLEGHRDYIHAVIFLSDSRLVVSGSRDSTMKIWETESGDLLQTIEGLLHCSNSMVISQDSTTMAIAYFSTIQVWDITQGKLLRTLRHWYSSTTVAISSDNRMVASGGGAINLWDVESGTELQVLRGHSNSISAVAFSPNNHLLASASYDKTIMLWDLESGALLGNLYTGAHIRSLCFTDDGASLQTECGLVSLSLLRDGEHVSGAQPPTFICVEDQWVSRNGENTLWIPPDYRTNVVAIFGRVVCLGCKSGRVVIMELAP